MSKSPESRIPRRTFLRGAAGVLGASALSFAPTSVLAKALNGALLGRESKPTVNVAYWDGSRFVPADALSSGDDRITSVRLTMRGFGGEGPLHAVDLHSVVEHDGGTQRMPFHAWTAAPNGCGQARFVMPVAADGLLFSAQVGDPKKPVAVEGSLHTGFGAGPKLTEGVYVLSCGDTGLGDFELSTEGAHTTVVRRGSAEPADFQHVVVTVERA